jgi:hypothetical protein
MNARRIGLTLVGGIAITLIAATCGPRGSRGGGRLLVDAGHWLMDTGDTMLPDAAADPVSLTLSCDQELSWTQEGVTTDFVSTGTFWYAEAEIAGLDPANVRTATAVVCGREQFEPADYCYDSYRCTGSRSPHGGFDCATAQIEIDRGRIRVPCGSRWDNTNSFPSPSGLRYHTAHVSIE